MDLHIPIWLLSLLHVGYGIIVAHTTMKLMGSAHQRMFIVMYLIALTLFRTMPSLSAWAFGIYIALLMIVAETEKAS